MSRTEIGLLAIPHPSPYSLVMTIDSTLLFIVNMNVTPALRKTHICKARAGRGAKGRSDFLLEALLGNQLFSWWKDSSLDFSILSCASGVSSILCARLSSL